MTSTRRAFQSAAIGAILAVVIALTMASCTVNRANQYTLEPALQLAWSAIEVQAINGGLTQEQVDEFGEALNDRDFSVVEVLWPTIERAANADIETRLGEGTIGPGVAESLRERLNKFTEGVALLARRQNE